MQRRRDYQGGGREAAEPEILRDWERPGRAAPFLLGVGGEVVGDAGPSTPLRSAQDDRGNLRAFPVLHVILSVVRRAANMK